MRKNGDQTEMRETALSLAGGLVLPGSTVAEQTRPLRRTGPARSVIGCVHKFKSNHSA